MQFSARSRMPEGPASSPTKTQGRPGFMGGVGRETHTVETTANYRGIDGANILGVVRGTEHPQRYIVVSAHYDHLGPGFNGADDNASGTAGILAIAEWLHAHPPRNSVIFAFFDAEEEGLLGSRAFFDKLPVPIDSIMIDVNLDMISRNANGELYAAGTFKWHAERPLLDSAAALHLVNLRFGHDTPGVADWTQRSDMAPFDERHIPFVHFGVEEHPDYHRPSDRPEKLQPEFYYHSVLTAAAFIQMADASLDVIAKERRTK
jgi:Zn-dependent M28 family amino/carboxypeptidase